MTAPSRKIKEAAQWLADQQGGDRKGSPAGWYRLMKSVFDLDDAQATEALLLAGNYSVCRRAFG
jgi:hypothetical protein